MTEDELAAMERENQMLAKRIAEAERLLAPRPPDEAEKLAQLQARADSIELNFGSRTLAPNPGESSDAYRRRLLARLQKHSDKWGDVRLDAAPPDLLATIEPEIYDAARRAGQVVAASSERLTPVTSTDESGRKITRFAGDISVFLDPFVADGAACKITRPGF